MLDRFQTAQTICQVQQQAVAPEPRCGGVASYLTILMPCAVRASEGASRVVCVQRQVGWLGVTCHREEVVVVHRCGNVRVIPGPPRAWACTAAGRLARPPSGIGLSLDSQSDGAVGWSPPGSAPDEVILRDVELPLGLDVERESKLGQHCVPLLLSCPDVLRTNQER